MEKLKESYGVESSKSAVHRALHQLKLSYITPRPIHHKQDKKFHPEFKKNLSEAIARNPSKKLYFFDEARFGTHSNLGHGWFPQGGRTAVKVKLEFQNFYVYSAVNINSGEDFSLIMPHVNTSNMNEFLAQLSQDLEENHAILVMDRAGWHRPKGLIIPVNIEIIYLPSYSPELNPVEKLWQLIKSYTIKNRIYETIDQLENTVCEFIRALNPE